MVFLFAIKKIGWDTNSFRKAVSDPGQALSLLEVAPGIIKQAAIAAVGRATDQQALARISRQEGNKMSGEVAWE